MLLKKKNIFIFLLIVLFVFFLNFNLAEAANNCNEFCKSNCGLENNPNLCRIVGAAEENMICSCCPAVIGQGNKYECYCQNSNKVICEVGGLFGGEKMAICSCCGDCDLSDFLYLGVNVAENILKYMGALALLLFVLGGIMWITSGGSKTRIQKGMAIIKGSLIGLAIIIFAFLMIRVIMEKVLKVEDQYLPQSTSAQEQKIS
ncbi:hypothetical protein K9K85_00365 [Patescibacteria group bacterium]|nr:hypothetical protein [Patescibacteria group bacterium]